VINCYKYHGREDLLPTFADDEDKVNALISQSGDEDEDMELSNPPTIHTVTTMTPPTGNSNVSMPKGLFGVSVGVFRDKNDIPRENNKLSYWVNNLQWSDSNDLTLLGIFLG